MHARDLYPTQDTPRRGTARVKYEVEAAARISVNLYLIIERKERGYNI